MIENQPTSEEVLNALSLNDRQKEAVLINDVPLLILAGAGSGKTRTIISKIVYDIEVLGVSPYNILAVTFTNKAADEMRNRLRLYMGEEKATGVTIKTFHSLGAFLLRKYALPAGLSPSFVIYDEDEARSLLSTKYPDLKIKDLKEPVKNIFAAKERGYSVKNYMSYSDSHTDVYDYFKTYDAALRESGNVDLPELISITTSLLLSNPDIRKQENERYKYIFIDEYQDTNAAQFSLVKALVGRDNIICVVGDDDQSIYGFRGSQVEHILRFTDFFKNARTVKLEENYRSTKSIIALASSVISHNQARHKKTLWTSAPDGDKAEYYMFNNEKEEASFVSGVIQKDKDYSSTAVLYRTNAQSAAFESAFMERGIPYHVLRGNSFYKRADIKDAVALMSFAINPSDAVAFLRITERPKRGIGESKITEIIEEASDKYSGNIRLSLLNYPLKGAVKNNIDELIRGLDSFINLVNEGKNQDALSSLLFTSGLYEYYKKVDEKEGRTTDKHTAALDALTGQMSSYSPGMDGIVEMLEKMAIVSLQDTSSEAGVALSTIHGVKGLEYDRVFITGLEQGLFPSSLDADEEEERRLMYVAITRARKRLYLSSALSRFRFGRVEYSSPSPFIKELDENYFIKFDRTTSSYYYAQNKPYHTSGGFDNSSPTSYVHTTPKSSKPYSKYDVLSRLKRASEIENSVYSSPRPKSPVVSDDIQETLPFKKGDRVKSDEIGEGTVKNIRLLKERYIMDVLFDSGRESVFPITTAKVYKI